MGSTKIDAPEIKPIDVAKQIRDTSRAYRQATPDIIAAERALRGPMQKLALEDYQTALLGDSRQARQDSAAAQAALGEARGERVTSEREIQARIDEIENRKFNPETERNRLRQQKEDYLGFIDDTQKQQRELLQQTANLDDGDIADNAAKAKKLDDVIADYKQAIGVMDAEIAGGDDYLTTQFKKDFDDRNQQDLGKIKLELDNLKTTGALSDEALEQLEGNATAAADAVLDSNPGMVDLADYAVRRQFETGEELKRAAAANEFDTIATLAPELVEMYRSVDPASTSLADLASQRAEQLSTGSTLEAKADLATLAEQVGARTPGGELGEAARTGAQELMGQEAMGQTADQQTVAGQIQNLLSGPQAGAAEQRLLQAAGRGPSVAEQRLLQTAGRPASQEAEALGQFGQQALQAGPRGASDVEQALQQQALQQLGFQAGGPSQEEQALQQRIGGLIESAGTLSPEQQRQAEQEALAMGQRQGRIRDTSTAAGVAGRLSEARRADEASDLMAAQQLLGQQQAMQQARTAEEMQRMGMGGQMAGSTEAMAQQRLAEQRAFQEMGMGATGTAAGLQAQQASLQQQAFQAAGGLAGQRTGQALQGLTGAGSLEQARRAQQLQGTGLAQNIAQSGFTSELAGREQQLREFGAGAQEAGRYAQQQAQQQSALAGLYGQQAGMEQMEFTQQQALSAMDDRRLQQAFGMQRTMAPDVGAFFGRPASQAAGLQVAGMGQQQAMYGTTPQATDPMLGVNMALQQQANQTNLDAAAMSASAQSQGGLMGGIGALGGGLFGAAGAVGGLGNLF
jgi:hypothetical protein